jgi:hypothetical protein
MRKDVIQQRFRRKNANSKDESSGNSPMDTSQSFVFHSNSTTENEDQLIKSFSTDHGDVSVNNDLQANEFAKWAAYVPSSQASTPSSTVETNAELTQNLLASLMNPKNLICDIGV